MNCKVFRFFLNTINIQHNFLHKTAKTPIGCIRQSISGYTLTRGLWKSEKSEKGSLVWALQFSYPVSHWPTQTFLLEWSPQNIGCTEFERNLYCFRCSTMLFPAISLTSNLLTSAFRKWNSHTQSPSLNVWPRLISQCAFSSMACNYWQSYGRFKQYIKKVNINFLVVMSIKCR